MIPDVLHPRNCFNVLKNVIASWMKSDQRYVHNRRNLKRFVKLRVLGIAFHNALRLTLTFRSRKFLRGIVLKCSYKWFITHTLHEILKFRYEYFALKINFIICHYESVSCIMKTATFLQWKFPCNIEGKQTADCSLIQWILSHFSCALAGKWEEEKPVHTKDTENSAQRHLRRIFADKIDKMKILFNLFQIYWQKLIKAG